jgi:DNA-binding beta-propeller fold protein YncE
MAYTVDYFGKVTKIDLNEYKIVDSEKYFDDNSFEGPLIEITPDGKKLFVAGANRKEPTNPLLAICAQDLMLDEKIYLPIKVKEGDLPPQVFGLQMIPDGKKVLISSYQFDPIEFKYPTYIIDTNSYKILDKNGVYFRTGESDPVFSKDGKFMYVAAPYSPLRILNLETYEVKEKWLYDVKEKLTDGLLFFDNALFVNVNNMAEINRGIKKQSYNALTKISLKNYEIEKIIFENKGYYKYAISPDRKIMYVISNKGLTMLDSNTFKEIKNIDLKYISDNYHCGYYYSQITPDSKYILFTNGIAKDETKGIIGVYDIEKDKMIKIIEIPDSFGAEKVVFGYEMVKISDGKGKEGKIINAGTKEVVPVKKKK